MLCFESYSLRPRAAKQNNRKTGTKGDLFHTLPSLMHELYIV